jgi:hypothetical protein
MKKKAATKKTAAVAKRKTDDIASLMVEVRDLIQSARRGVASVVDTFQVMTNFEIGRRIVEHEQQGEKRAEYGKEMLKELSARLTEEFGRGFSRSNLEYMRKFFLIWKERIPPNFQTPSENLRTNRISQQATGKLALSPKSQQPTVKLAIPQTLSGKSPFTLSWTHYVVLLTVKDPDERSFYEIEATHEGWSVPELKRQKASSLYERLALSRDKEGIRKLAREGQVITKPEDLLKDPLVLDSNNFCWSWARASSSSPANADSPSTKTTTSWTSSSTIVSCVVMSSSTSSSTNSAIRISGRCRCM